MPLHVSSTCAHHREVKIALHSLWFHHTYRWPSRAQVERVLSQPVHQTATYRCDDTRGCVMQFWPPDDEHMCSKHVEAWNKLIVNQNFCASSWLITKIKINGSEVDWACGTYGREEKCMQVLVGKFRGREHLENLSIGGKILLKCILKK